MMRFLLGLAFTAGLFLPASGQTEDRVMYYCGKFQSFFGITLNPVQNGNQLKK
jgi:hypothetical protein